MDPEEVSRRLQKILWKITENKGDLAGNVTVTLTAQEIEAVTLAYRVVHRLFVGPILEEG
jgi:hypothetical protein